MVSSDQEGHVFQKGQPTYYFGNTISSGSGMRTITHNDKSLMISWMSHTLRVRAIPGKTVLEMVACAPWWPLLYPPWVLQYKDGLVALRIQNFKEKTYQLQTKGMPSEQTKEKKFESILAEQIEWC
jgi:hypothetical protein